MGKAKTDITVAVKEGKVTIQAKAFCNHASKYSDHPSAKCAFIVTTNDMTATLEAMGQHWKDAHADG